MHFKLRRVVCFSFMSATIYVRLVQILKVEKFHGGAFLLSLSLSLITAPEFVSMFMLFIIYYLLPFPRIPQPRQKPSTETTCSEPVELLTFPHSGSLRADKMQNRVHRIGIKNSVSFSLRRNPTSPATTLQNKKKKKKNPPAKEKGNGGGRGEGGATEGERSRAHSLCSVEWT